MVKPPLTVIWFGFPLFYLRHFPLSQMILISLGDFFRNILTPYDLATIRRK